MHFALSILTLRYLKLNSQRSYQVKGKIYLRIELHHLQDGSVHDATY